MAASAVWNRFDRSDLNVEERALDFKSRVTFLVLKGVLKKARFCSLWLWRGEGEGPDTFVVKDYKNGPFLPLSLTLFFLPFSVAIFKVFVLKVSVMVGVYQPNLSSFFVFPSPYSFPKIIMKVLVLEVSVMMGWWSQPNWESGTFASSQMRRGQQPTWIGKNNTWYKIQPTHWIAFSVCPPFNVLQ